MLFVISPPIEMPLCSDTEKNYGNTLKFKTKSIHFFQFQTPVESCDKGGF